MLQKLYTELFSWAFDNDFELEKTFEDLLSWSQRANPKSEQKFAVLYAKVFKSKAFYLFSPIIYLFVKFQMMKYTNHEYLESLISRQFEDKD